MYRVERPMINDAIYKDELIVSISFDIEFHSFEEVCIVRDDTLIKGKYVLCIKLV